MIRLTDHSATTRPTQHLIAEILSKPGPGEAQGDDVLYDAGSHLVLVSGDTLVVDRGQIVSGTITGIEARLAPFAPSDAGASFAFDPRIGTVKGLSLSATDFGALLQQAASGQINPLRKALSEGGLTYQDSYYDNFAKGGHGDDLFLDRSGTDIYRGGTGIDTLSYAASVLDDSVPSPTGGATGITADLRDGTVLTYGFPPPLFFASAASQPGAVIVQIDRVRAIENVTGSALDDTLLGDDAANILRGLGGDDLIRGRKGDDVIDGGNGDDRLNGNRGDDTIRSGDGNDRIKGGPGADTFVFDLFEDGRNVIRDFNPEEDEIELSLLGFDLSITQRGDDVVIRHTDDQPWVPAPEDELSSITIILRDTHLDDLVMGDNLSIFYAQY